MGYPVSKLQNLQETMMRGEGLFEVAPLRCPQCRGTDFLVETDGEFRISDDRVCEITGLDVGKRTQVTCEDCSFIGTMDLFSPKLQDRLDRDKLVEMITSKLKGFGSLAKIASDILGVCVSVKDPDNDDTPVTFVILEKDKKGGK